jgi:Rap1a immunity proteins
LIGAVAAIMPVQAQTRAAAFSGNGLIAGCHRFADNDPDGTPDALQQGACAGIVWAAWLFSARDGLICSPKGTTVFQVARVAVRYMDQHPAYLDRDLTVLVRWSLIDAWPCAASKPRAGRRGPIPQRS